MGVPPLPSYQRLHQRPKMGLIRRVGHVPVRTLEGGWIGWAIFRVPPPGGGYPPKMAPRDPPNRPPGGGYPPNRAPRGPPGAPSRGPFPGPLPGSPGGPLPDPRGPAPGTPPPPPGTPSREGVPAGRPGRTPQTPGNGKFGDLAPKLGKMANFQENQGNPQIWSKMAKNGVPGPIRLRIRSYVGSFVKKLTNLALFLHASSAS